MCRRRLFHVEFGGVDCGPGDVLVIAQKSMPDTIPASGSKE
jgi:hypothetical protein